MMRAFFVSVFICLAQYSQGSTIKRSTCDREQLNKCMSTFHSAQKIFDYSKRDTNQQLAECSLYDDMVECLNTNNVLDDCRGTMQWLLVRLSVDAFGYICGEGRQDTLANMDCFENPAIEDLVGECMSTFYSQLSSSSDACSEANDIPACIGSKTSSLCSSESAGSTMKEIMNHGMTGLREMYC